MSVDKLSAELDELKKEAATVRDKLSKLRKKAIWDYPCDICGAPARQSCAENRHQRDSVDYEKDNNKFYDDKNALEKELQTIHSNYNLKAEELDKAANEELANAVLLEATSSDTKSRFIRFKKTRSGMYEVVEAKNFYRLKAGDRVAREMVDLFEGTSVETETVKDIGEGYRFPYWGPAGER